MERAYDLVVRGGTLADGTGAATYEADVAIKDGRIAAVGEVRGRGAEEIDAKGLLGQIVDVGVYHSRVLLITDSAHAIPVRISRNGLRAVAEGSGRIDELSVAHVAATTDIQVGDLLVSSGLGDRFPSGYPVGEVTRVAIDPGKPFAEINARPLAELDRSRNVLLVFSDKIAVE